MIDTTGPQVDQVEVSLFGPGVGESLVLHLGENQWFIVDSCLDKNTKEPAAKKYLESLGVPLENVVGILITHWHADHISGAYELLTECVSAKLFCSDALLSSEAIHFAQLFNVDRFSGLDRPVRQFSQIVNFLFEQGDQNRFERVKAKHTFFSKKVGGVDMKLTALSPSAAASGQALASIVAMTPNQKGQERVSLVVPQEANLNAVALHFSFGHWSILLGSDLEVTTNAHTGWHAIIQSDIYDALSLPKSDVFKVPHHGSINGHLDAVWNDLLKDKPISIATPYARGGSPLPKESDIDRISQLSTDFWLTRPHPDVKPPTRERSVDKEINAIAKNRRARLSEMGQIQMRINANGQSSLATNDIPRRF